MPGWWWDLLGLVLGMGMMGMLLANLAPYPVP
jgi:hypothetical protein